VIIFLRDKRVLGVFIFLGENSVPSAALREKKNKLALCERGSRCQTKFSREFLSGRPFMLEIL
jgi:hypothetical protein